MDGNDFFRVVAHTLENNYNSNNNNNNNNTFIFASAITHTALIINNEN